MKVFSNIASKWTLTKGPILKRKSELTRLGAFLQTLHQFGLSNNPYIGEVLKFRFVAHKVLWTHRYTNEFFYLFLYSLPNCMSMPLPLIPPHN